MREAFLADASDLFERIESIVVGLSREEDPRAAIPELARCLHTLKGAAGSVGLHELATLVHAVEERLGQAGLKVSPGLNDLLHQVVGYLDELIGLLRRGPDPPGKMPPSAGETPVPSQGPGAEGPIRVPASRFDELADLASELIVQARFWLSQAGSTKTFATTVQVCRNRLLGSLDRLHDHGLGREGRNRPAGFDPRADLPGQLRHLAEQANDLAVLAESAQAAAAMMVDRGDSLVRLSLQLWDSFQSLRIVPIRSLFQRLARVGHEAARVEGRQVEFVLVGEETGVDRAVQDKAFEPLLHVVRNAVSHGIESPAERARLGKLPTGRITLEARREGNTLVIAVGDDGQGLDNQAIAAKARRLGWLGPDEQPGPDRLRALIFEPGFSTKTLANAVSGRGVGMDVVAREVGQLRGSLDLDWHPGRGTRLTVRLPARLALDPALIVRVGGQPFAIPAAQVEHVQPFEPVGCRTDAPPQPAPTEPTPAPLEGRTVTYHDQAIPVVFGREILGIGRPAAAPWPKLVLVRTGSRLIGLVVDAIDGAEDLVIKPLGELLAGHPLVSGTSLSINAEVILVLNASGLQRWLKVREALGTGPAASDPARGLEEGSPGERRAVLVVDDSISVRRGVARQLHGLGLDVQEVSDGLEALGRLRSARYALVVTDLEMPKLDGLALLAEIKRSATWSTIPVIVASTRGDPETRQRVLELGAEALLSKPVDPQELARIVEPFLSGVRG
jgi:chemotaxis protein histidine kinase CheA